MSHSERNWNHSAFEGCETERKDSFFAALNEILAILFVPKVKKENACHREYKKKKIENQKNCSLHLLTKVEKEKGFYVLEEVESQLFIVSF